MGLRSLIRSQIIAYLLGFTLPLVVWLGIQATAWGQLSEHDRTRLVSELGQAASNVSEDRFPNLEHASSTVLQGIAQVRELMQSQPSKENGQAWLKYLSMDALASELQSSEKVLETVKEAFEVRFRLVSIHPGLDRQPLGDLRDSIENFIAAARFRDSQKSAEQIRKQLHSLAERIEQLDTVPSLADGSEISALVGLLDESGQATQAVGALRNVFGRPNIALHIGESMVQRVVNRAVSESRPVRDCILGTRIVGDAYTQGSVNATLMPSVGSARMQLFFSGQVTTNNIGYNRSVRVRNSGNASVTATRILNVNETGLTSQPVVASASLSTQIHAIEHPLGIVRRIARKRAAEQKPLAEQIGAEKMRKQIGQEFAQQTNEAMAINPADISGRITPILNGLSLADPVRQWASSSDAIMIDATLRRSDQIAAVVSRPSIQTSFDLAVQVHESAIDNAFSPLLAGRTVAEREVSQLLSQAGLQQIQESQQATSGNRDGEPPFEIDFARLQPIIFEARDEVLRIGIRGTRFAQGTRSLTMPMEITAEYRAATAMNGEKLLVREKLVNVQFAGRTRLSISQTALKRTIQERFNELFPETLLHRDLEVPAQFQIDALRGKRFRTSSIEARDGWLTITAS